MSALAHESTPSAVAPRGLPRLLAGRRPEGPMSLDEHLQRHGPAPVLGRRREQSTLLHLIDRAGLRGRGGAGFPTARKMRAVAGARGRRFVVANGAEGEPASAKDRLLMTSVPHLVLDGAALAAEAVRADEVIVAVDRAAHGARQSMQAALEARQISGLDPVSVRIVAPPTRYVAGEESALMQWINGGPAKPTFVPPRPFERGVAGRPTLVQNVETLAHVALIARFGDQWFRTLGSSSEPGSALVTVTGAVAQPGVCEIELGSPMASVVSAAGGPTEELSAFLVGGYFGTWLPATTASNVPLGDDGLRAISAAFGCGAVVALPTSSCGVLETARVARYLADETAGQCGPCVYGLDAVAAALEALALGTGSRDGFRQLRRWLQELPHRGACSLPDGAVRFVSSALDAFSADVHHHERHGPCRRVSRAAVLPLPAAETREWGWR